MPVIFYQKLLEAILSKSITQATPWLQRILRTFAYHFTVKDIPGSTNQLTDCLSLLGGPKDTIKLPKLHIHQITNQLSARSDSLNQMRIATKEEDELAHTSIPSCMYGHVPSEKYQVKYNHIGPSEKSWPLKIVLSWREPRYWYHTINIKLHFNSYMKDICVLVNVSSQPKIQCIGLAWMTSLRS